ncbi:MAG: hypothetical protein CMJ65_17750 [Planctomycetaceae bacterium]|nr:hypothetical protein [Planctomycetaceae bacterium]
MEVLVCGMKGKTDSGRTELRSEDDCDWSFVAYDHYLTTRESSVSRTLRSVQATPGAPILMVRRRLCPSASSLVQWKAHGQVGL